MDERALHRRVIRRETHASRTLPAVVAGSVLFAAAIALLIGAVWWAIDPAFRRWAGEAGANIAGVLANQQLAVAVGAVLVLAAVVCIVLAVGRGRRARRARSTERVALVVDDGVLADSIAENVARRTGVERRRVSVIVGRRTTTVRITPTSGVPVDRARGEAAVVDTLASVGFTTTPRILIAADGVIA